MRNKVKRIIKKYPVLIGYISIFILLAIIVCYWYYGRKTEITSTVIPEELAREYNIEMLKTPEDAAEYFAHALTNKDIDQIMRSFPIDELCLKENFAELVNEKQVFSAAEQAAPSKTYRDYFPLSSSETVGMYTDMYLETVKKIDKIQGAEIKEILYLSPQTQMEAEYQLRMMEQCEIYGADLFCEMEILLETDKDIWSIPLTLVNYDGYWKVFRVGSSLQENAERKENIESVDYTVQKRLDKELQKKLKDKGYGKTEKKSADEADYKKLIESGKALLPANYVVTNSIYEDTPERLIQAFVRYIQKKDLTALLTLGSTGNGEKELGHVTAESLKEQRNFAKEIKYFYYSFLLEEDAAKDLSLKQLGMTSQEVLNKLNPENFFYLELKEMVKKDKNVYAIYFRYEGEYYKFKFELVEYGQGWQIKHIEAEKKLTEKEYRKETQNLEK